MRVRKLVGVGVACLAMCGASVCIGFKSVPEGSLYEDYLQKLETATDALIDRIKKSDNITAVPSKKQKDSYNKSKKYWDEVFGQLFDSIDETITTMGSKKTLGIKFGFGGMAGKDQQLVKDVKIFAKASSEDMYRMLKAGVKPEGKTIDSVDWQIKEIKYRLNKLDTEKEGNEKTRNVKEALVSVLKKLRRVYEAMLDKTSKKSPAKKIPAKKSPAK